jgi:hypothetical protein
MGKDNERPNCKSFACQADRKAKAYVYGGPKSLRELSKPVRGLNKVHLARLKEWFEEVSPKTSYSSHYSSKDLS